MVYYFMTDVKTEYVLNKYNEVFRSIPLDKLEYKKQVLVKDCLTGRKDFSDSEMDKLASVVRKYGQAVQDIEATEYLSNQEKVIDTIQTEKDLLDLLEKEQVEHELSVNLPTQSGTKLVTFEVLPITDSRALTTLEAHASLFDDFSMDERNFFQKAQQDPDSLSTEEREVYEHLLTRLNDNALANSEEMIVELLSHQLRIKGQELDLEVNRRIWKLMRFNVKMAIFMKVEEILGLKDFDTEDLFRSVE